jgi:hypothetical protein
MAGTSIAPPPGALAAGAAIEPMRVGHTAKTSNKR